jgi:hypothetical protein
MDAVRRVEARRGACGAVVTYSIEIDRLVDELPAGDARIAHFKPIHRRD